MTYAYSTGPRRRLVLGPPQAPARLCVPIPREVYDALVAMPEQEQEDIGQVLAEWVGATVRAWQQPAPASETAAAEEAAPEESGDWERGLHL